MDDIILSIKHGISPYAWLISAVVLIMFFVYLFRQQIKALIPKINEVVFKSENKEFRIGFDKIVQEAKAQAKDIEKDVSSSKISSPPEEKIEAGNLTARDIVLEAWSALKQTTYNSCSALHITMTPATQINAAVDRLVEANALEAHLATPIKQLHALGQELANNIKYWPTMESAYHYKSLSDTLVDWMMLHILTPSRHSTENTQKPPRRATVVGTYSPEPSAAKAAATLLSVEGLLAGNRYKIAKTLFKIGRDNDNDLCVKDDEYISGKHALLSYRDGGLFLSDQNSRNGTFLNGKKIGVPVMVHQGDKIQVGGSVFQLI